MFGGKGKGGKAMNDSWIFESDTETWKRPAVISDLPVPVMLLSLYMIRTVAAAASNLYWCCQIRVVCGQTCGKFDV